MLQNSNTATIQPKVVVIRRRPNQGFGFTLRHFIAYPPEDDPSWPQEASDPYQVKAMETIFIKEVQANGPAHYANLQTGDRVLMVNNTPIAGIAYSTIVSMIKQTPSVLTLHVVPKECDVLQMHYTGIAHTPESNRLGVTKPIPSPVTVGNGNAAGALIPLAAASATATKTFPQQLISYPPLGKASRSSSITSNSSNNFRALTTDFIDMPHGMQHSALLMRGDGGGFVRTQPPNLTVLSRQAQQQQQQQSASFYPPNAATASDTSDLMIRLRESIKQKEEFLKSPIPHAIHQQHHHQQQQYHQQQHFFPNTPPSGSPQLSMVSTSSTSAGSSVLSAGPRGQVRALVKQPLSATSSASSTRELLPAGATSCDMQHYYAATTTTTTATSKNLPGNFITIESAMSRGANVGAGGNGGMSGESMKSTTFSSVTRSQQQRQVNVGTSSGSNGGGLRDKYPKDLDYMETTLQDTGVTNKVFERKLVSHMAKGFDPFKPLSINTNAIETTAAAASAAAAAAAAGPGNAVMLKKPGVLYDSLQHHPLHQMQLQQLQHTQLPKVHHASVVDGTQCSRMEIHKASLATTTLEYTPNKYASKLAEADEKLPQQLATTLTDIAENSDDIGNVKAVATSDSVVRRFKPMSSFDDSKPMRRISYLRATNNENDYPSDTSSLNATTLSAGSGGVVGDVSKELIEEDPTYDVVAEDPRDNGEALVLDIDEVKGATALCTFNEGRRASLGNERRHSIQIEHLGVDFSGKNEAKDVPNELEVFETEMEIKSSCIHGKRLSEYRSWRLVKIEIKGDTLKIHPHRSSKSDNNVIDLDIRNFNFSDETVDKKKYVFRMQTKPFAHLATLGNELNLDDVPEKLTPSCSSASTTATQTDQPTEILFKTKSLTEMRRIFGLLQWKNSLIFDEDTELQGKQLAEPQKTAATASMPTANYCDENAPPVSQQLQPEYSPLSLTSRSELETGDSISPVMKTRKSSSHKNIPDKDLGSPKAKNWKDLLFRRGGGSHNADISPSNLASAAKTIGSIGVPLRACPMSKNNEYVPHIVDICTDIVETKGLGIIGIYRIPGNKAAISELSEQVNKSDFSWDRCHTDVRWEDVNVVSSLLKLFIRSLPDALLPCSFYINFIEADKKTGMVRLQELKELLESLPRHSYETMKHLIRHLSRVSKNCEVNLMEPKNLAIIFGPSIIRTPNDTLEIAVKDMKHQCRIVELLVTQYDYFFENGSTPNIADVSGNAPIATTSSSTSASAQSQEEQTNMLLHNVSKIERLTERETTTRTSRFIPQLRRRTHSKRSGVSSDTYSGESVLSLDYTKSSALTTSSSSTNATAASSSSSSSTNNASASTAVAKKKERGFLSHAARSHHRKASLDEKDSGSGSGSGSGGSMSKEQQRSSVDISILLTDEESSNSRSDTGSMSLTTITDTLDSKLRNLRSGSESNDENGSPEFPKNRRHTFGQPLHLHSENIPYADESPERHFHGACPLDAPSALMLSRSCTATNTIGVKAASEREKEKEQRAAVLSISAYKSNKLQHSATAPINTASASTGNGAGGAVATPPNAASTPTAQLATAKSATAGSGGTSANAANVSGGGGSGGGGSARNSYTGKNLRFSSSVYEQQCCSEDDSEGSTTSDPKESLVIASPSFFLERYNKKRRDHRLFRSASFNCRNYSTRHGVAAGTGAGGVGGSGGGVHTSALTKDEKTDMNLTKKRQIQNKQNRSIKRRHTVGGPHDYAGNGAANNCNHHCKATTTTTTTTTVLRRIPIPSANGNISNNNNNNSNGAQPSDSSSSNGNGGGGSGSSGSAAAAGAGGGGGGEHVLEVGIRIKNINRSRY